MEAATRHAVVHYAEIGLKGRNRPFFERTLARNIARRLENRGLQQVERLSGRMLVHLDRPLERSAWAESLGTVFGIAHFGPAILSEREMDAIRTTVLENLPPGPVGSFRIRTTRDDKTFPLTSPEIDRELGAAVQQRTDWPVQLKNADLVIGIEVMHDRVIISLGRLPGPGGLPVGASGTTLRTILSVPVDLCRC